MLGVIVVSSPTRGRSSQVGSSRRPGNITPEVVPAVVGELSERYGLPRHGNPHRALDDLFYILLSNRTTAESAHRTYRALRRVYRSWGDIRPREAGRLRALLQPAGLANIRAAQIIGIVEALRAQFGSVTLAPLKDWTESDVEAFLTDLPGVSTKVAKCVMMYTLGFSVLPVDTHVHRIAVRLGWTTRKRADQCHEELESLVPPSLRYSFHVSCLAHGRAVCRPTDPRCDVCAVRRFCDYYRTRRSTG